MSRSHPIELDMARARALERRRLRLSDLRKRNEKLTNQHDEET
jgi:hypothetical protein